MKAKYEKLVEWASTEDIGEALKASAAEGWELVSVTPSNYKHNTSFGGVLQDTDVSVWMLIWKRPVDG